MSGIGSSKFYLSKSVSSKCTASKLINSPTRVWGVLKKSAMFLGEKDNRKFLRCRVGCTILISQPTLPIQLAQQFDY